MSDQVVGPAEYMGQMSDYFGKTDCYGILARRDWTPVFPLHGHYGYPGLLGLPGDLGGSLNIIKKTMRCESFDIGTIHGSGGYKVDSYTGKVWAPDVGSTATWNGSTIKGDATAWGPSAYKQMKPTKPAFNALNAFYEMREFPSMLRQRFLDNHLHAIPNYWLALKFGWEPLLSDLRKCYDFQTTAQKKLAWLLQRNGKPTRTKTILKEESELWDGGWDYTRQYPGFVTQFYADTPYATYRSTLFDRVWASARWRFWLPDTPPDYGWSNPVVQKLFGLYPSPSQLWNSLPWTWLIDWFSSVGDILENMDIGVADRLTADSFYVMRESGHRGENSYFAKYHSFPSDETIAVQVTSHYEVVQKTRLPGDPFGFNTNPNDLSAMQLSILGALGWSRLPSRL
jgi:hypothetical protein